MTESFVYSNEGAIVAAKVVRKFWPPYAFALVSSFLLAPEAYAQGLQAFVGKWSDSSDKTTCEIPVGSSPEVATTYQISPKSVVYYEIECTTQDVSAAVDRIEMNVDCFKGGGSRWFEKLMLTSVGPNKLRLTSSNRKPPVGNTDRTPTTLYRCPAEAVDSPGESGCH